MKLKSLLSFLCMSLSMQIFAANLHVNPKANVQDKQSITKKAMYPGYCEIEVINASYDNLTLFGTYEDGSSIGFDILRYDAPHHISLFYNTYCHAQMYITIKSGFYTVYSGWTPVDSVIRIVPFLQKQGITKQSAGQQLKVEISKR